MNEKRNILIWCRVVTQKRMMLRMGGDYFESRVIVHIQSARIELNPNDRHQEHLKR
jgi:hypothetical protein